MYALSQAKFTSNTVLHLEGQALVGETASLAEAVEKPEGERRGVAGLTPRPHPFQAPLRFGVVELDAAVIP
ncbi:hypothetical protein OFC05_28140, partial [Escherichia coli]|nr:hypothetical protein [Escherichia coli]